MQAPKIAAVFCFPSLRPKFTHQIYALFFVLPNIPYYWQKDTLVLIYRRLYRRVLRTIPRVLVRLSPQDTLIINVLQVLRTKLRTISRVGAYFFCPCRLCSLCRFPVYFPSKEIGQQTKNRILLFRAAFSTFFTQAAPASCPAGQHLQGAGNWTNWTLAGAAQAGARVGRVGPARLGSLCPASPSCIEVAAPAGPVCLALPHISDLLRARRREGPGQLGGWAQFAHFAQLRAREGFRPAVGR